MNTRISDAAVEAAWQEYEKLAEWGDALGADAERACMRAALEAALPHLHPAKPEAVRLRDELRQRAAFENWAENQFVLTRKDAGYLSTLTTYSWEAWQAALASVQLSPEMDAGLYQWLKERDLLPDADEDGGIDMDAVIQALNEHELMLGGVQPSPAWQGNALAALVAEWETRHGVTDAYRICAGELKDALAARQPVGDR